jgi:hypothetical protein
MDGFQMSLALSIKKMVVRAGLDLARLVLGADWNPDRLLGYAVGGRLFTTEHGKEQPVISHRLKVGGKTPGGTCLITGRETLPEVIVPACAVGHTLNARLCPPNEGTVEGCVVFILWRSPIPITAGVPILRTSPSILPVRLFSVEIGLA